MCLRNFDFDIFNYVGGNLQLLIRKGAELCFYLWKGFRNANTLLTFNSSSNEEDTHENEVYRYIYLFNHTT